MGEPIRKLTCSAILFDMDGVLVDSSAVVRRVWQTWAESRGLNAARILGVAHGRRTMDTLNLVAPHLDVATEVAWLERAELADSVGVKSIKGAPRLLAALPRQRWAVVTSASRELALLRLQWAGLPAPSVLVSADQVTHGKPSPEGYLLGARRLGFSGTDCIVVEDAPAGVEAAHSAGMIVIGLTTTHGPELLTNAAAVLPDLVGVKVDVGSRKVQLSLPLS